MDFSIKVLAISDNSNFSIFLFFLDNDVDVNDVDDDDVDDDVVSQLVSVSV